MECLREGHIHSWRRHLFNVHQDWHNLGCDLHTVHSTSDWHQLLVSLSCLESVVNTSLLYAAWFWGWQRYDFWAKKVSCQYALQTHNAKEMCMHQGKTGTDATCSQTIGTVGGQVVDLYLKELQIKSPALPSMPFELWVIGSITRQSNLCTLNSFKDDQGLLDGGRWQHY